MKFKDKLPQSDRFVIQLEVPHSVYGVVTYFPPTAIRDWLATRALRAEYTGWHNWGNGFRENGITNTMSTYMIQCAQETDGVALRIMFPDCKVIVIEKCGYD